MTFIQQILSWGIWPAVPVTGMLFIRHLVRISRPDNLPQFSFFSLQCVTGFAVWSMILLSCAYYGIFRGDYFGAVGWVLVLGWCSLRLKNIMRIPFMRFESPDLWDIFFAFGVSGAFALYIIFPAESIWGGRDMGTYANHAVNIVREGSLFVPIPATEEFKDFVLKYFWIHPGMARSGDFLFVHLPSLYQVWLAQAFSSFGSAGLFRINAFFALLFLGAFYGISRLFLKYKPAAMFATLFLAFNVSQIWVTRQTLTEIFNQMFLWAGMLSFLMALFQRNNNMARLAGFIIGSATLIRIDSYVIFPLIFLSHIIIKIIGLPSITRKSSVYISFYQTSLPFCVISILYYRFVNTVYLNQQLDQLSHVGYAILIAGLILLACTKRVSRMLSGIFTNKYNVLGICVIVVAFALYAYWVRPLNENVNGFYFENSAANLAEYISPYIFWVGIIGWVFYFYQLLVAKAQVNLAVMMVVIGGFTVLYLWKPSIYPDHFWAIRRFVPVIIPGIVLSSFFLMDQIYPVLPKSINNPLSVFVIILLSTFTFRVGGIIFTFPEHKGAFAAIDAFAQELPKDELILLQEYNNGELSIPLNLSFGCKVLPVHLDRQPGPEILRGWIKKQIPKDKPVYLLTNMKPLPINVRAGLIKQAKIPFAKTQPTIHPIPNNNLHSNRILSLYQVSEILEKYYGQNLIRDNLMEVVHSGFYSPEKLDNGDVLRWTNGNAKLSVPLENTAPQKIFFDFGDAGPKGRDVSLLVNGNTLYQGYIPSGEWVNWFPIDPDEWKKTKYYPFRRSFISSDIGEKEFLTLLYRSFLNREPDPGGIHYWMKQLDNKQDWARVTNDFLSAPEFNKIFRRYGISQKKVSSQVPDHSKIKTFILRFYNQSGIKKTNPTELEMWMHYLANGSKSGVDFLRSLVFTQGFINRHTINGKFMYEENNIVIEIKSDTFNSDSGKKQPLGVAVRNVLIK